MHFCFLGIGISLPVLSELSRGSFLGLARTARNGTFRVLWSVRNADSRLF